jgi:hypothetical protein
VIGRFEVVTASPGLWRSEAGVGSAEQLEKVELTHRSGSRRSLPDGAKRWTVGWSHHAPSLPVPGVTRQTQPLVGEGRSDPAAALGGYHVQVIEVGCSRRKREGKRPRCHIGPDRMRHPGVSHRYPAACKARNRLTSRCPTSEASAGQSSSSASAIRTPAGAVGTARLSRL